MGAGQSSPEATLQQASTTLAAADRASAPVAPAGITQERYPQCVDLNQTKNIQCLDLFFSEPVEDADNRILSEVHIFYTTFEVDDQSDPTVRKINFSIADQNDVLTPTATIAYKKTARSNKGRSVIVLLPGYGNQMKTRSIIVNDLEGVEQELLID